MITIKPYICLTLRLLSLCLIVNGDGLTKTLNDMAEKDLCINGALKPAKNCYLSEGAIGFIYKGTMHPSGKEVAMKFTPSNRKARAQKEYEIYTYLDAIDNEICEQYGIPCVYYYAPWDDYIIMAITLLDEKFENRVRNGVLNEVDLLIICREFVRISKYIHGHNVRHSDVHLLNMIFRKNQGFIIDFNVASKMNISDSAVLLSCLPRWALKDGKLDARMDWAIFFCDICAYMGISFDGVTRATSYKIFLRRGGHINRKSKYDIDFKLEEIVHGGLRRVLKGFAARIFYTNNNLSKGKTKNAPWISFYDDLYQIINEEIEKYAKEKPAMVSWLTNEEKEEAKLKLPPSISSNVRPFQRVKPKYPEVKLDYFDKMYPAVGSLKCGANTN